MLPDTPARPDNLTRAAFEWALGLVVLAFAAYQVWFFIENGYLAQPFFYDTNDTLMDFYNTAYWSHTDGPYTVWNSIYPPLSFALLKYLTPAQCYLNDGMIGRDCDALSWLILVAAMVWLALEVFRQSRDSGMATRLARVTALLIGLPTLYCLERGNLLLLAAPALVYGITQPRAGWRACLALAFAINLKPYLVILLLPMALLHDRRAALRLLMACALIYIASVIIVGDGLPWQILSNVMMFTGEGVINFWEKFYFSSSFSPFIRILESDLPLENYLDGQTIILLLSGMKLALALSAVGLLAALVAAWKMPAEDRPVTVTFAAVLTFCIVLTEAFGGYATLFITALLFTRNRPAWMVGVALVLCYVLSIPFDYPINIVRESEAPIWLSGKHVETQYGIAVGQAARPALIVVVHLLLCASVVQQAWNLRQHRRQASARGAANVH